MSVLARSRDSLERLSSALVPVLRATVSPAFTRTRFLKYLFYFLLLVNIKSAPFTWHVRIFRSVVLYRIRTFFLHIGLYLRHPRSPRLRQVKFNDWFDTTISPVGLNPFKTVTVYRTRATIDDCDFNGHLSNSSYGKTFDHARFKAAVTFFPNFLRIGGWVPLGATHYHFIREIPMFTPYDVRVSILTWDSKWVFVVGRFVTKPKPGSKAAKSHTPAALKSSHRTPATPGEIEGNNTPPTFEGAIPVSGGKDPIDALKELTRDAGEPDGAVVHCIAVAEVCYKIGRITVPPAMIFSSDGMCTTRPPHTEDGSTPVPYSITNPPPHWERVHKLRANRKEFMKVMTGGWRDVPEEERWWEEAYRGEGEEKRKANLEALDAIRKGMDAARRMY